MSTVEKTIKRVQTEPALTIRISESPTTHIVGKATTPIITTELIVASEEPSKPTEATAEKNSEIGLSTVKSTSTEIFSMETVHVTKQMDFTKLEPPTISTPVVNSFVDTPIPNYVPENIEGAFYPNVFGIQSSVLISTSEQPILQTKKETTRRTRRTRPTKQLNPTNNKVMDEFSSERPTREPTTRRTRKPKPTKTPGKTTPITEFWNISNQSNYDQSYIDKPNEAFPDKYTENPPIEVTSEQTTRRTRRTKATKKPKPSDKPIDELPGERPTVEPTTRKTKPPRPTTDKPTRPTRRTRPSTELPGETESSTATETTTRRTRRPKTTRKAKRTKPTKTSPTDLIQSTEEPTEGPPKRLKRPNRYRPRPVKKNVKSEARAIASNSSANDYEAQWQCSENEDYLECGPNCPETCEQNGIRDRHCRVNCRRGCFCKEGFIRHKDSCIKKDECTGKSM